MEEVKTSIEGDEAVWTILQTYGVFFRVMVFYPALPLFSDIGAQPIDRLAALTHVDEAGVVAIATDRHFVERQPATIRIGDTESSNSNSMSLVVQSPREEGVSDQQIRLKFRPRPVSRFW